jgi:signal transduction histidine kinase
LDKFSRRAEIDVRVEVIAEEKRLPSEIETALYRIIQEALTNVIKHAKAKKVDLQFDIRSDVVIVKIKDDGRGFDSGSLQLPDTPFLGLGLIGMADRTALVGGDLRIYSRPGEGTQIEIEIPL